MKKRTSSVFQIGSCFLLALLIILVLSRAFAVVMISPDDIGYEKIMSGRTTGVPDGHTHFLRYPLSACLAVLYRICSSVSWYQLFLMGSLLLCLVLIFERVRYIMRGRKILYLIIAALSAVILFAVDIVHLEWTVTAGILGATAIFRFVTMPAEMGRGRCIWEYAVCAVLLVLCFCLRNTVAYMFIPLAGLCWLRSLFYAISGEKQNKKKKIIRLIVFLLVCLFLVGAVMLIHRLAYSSEAWKAYQDYTKDRSALFDYYGYPDYDTYYQEYQAAGISREAFLLMKTDYNYLVPCDNFKDMDLKAIADLARSIHIEDETAKLKAAWKTIKGILIGEKYLLLNVIIIVLMICNFIAYKDKKMLDVLFVAATVCWAAAMAAYLAYDGRFPERVVKCVDYGLILVLLGNLLPFWCAGTNTERKKLTATKVLLSIFLVFALCVTAALNCRKIRDTNEKQEVLATAHMQLLQYCAENPDNIYFRDFWSFSQRGQLFMRTEYNVDNYQSTGGWTYHSPVYDTLLQNWDCVDLYSAIAENQNIYYLVAESRYEAVYGRLNAYFATEGLPVVMEVADVFATNSNNENVFVLKFSSY